jgi:galactokinase
MDVVSSAIEDFQNVFGEPPAAFGCAPGRVEVLGNHTDYNEGFILSAAINRFLVVCGRAVPGDTAKVYSRTFNAGDSFSVSAPNKTQSNFWINYMAGVVAELRQAGLPIGAFNALVLGDVPLGAGLSSSAALEVATAMFLRQIYPYEMERVRIALTCQAAENKFVGVNCGILDQFSSVMGKQDHLIFLDCRDLTKFDTIPLGADVELVLAHTNAHHELADGTYNRLREDCFAAARHFAGAIPSRKITHLRDLSQSEFEKHRTGLAEPTMRRARHIVTENERVLRGVEALRKGDRKMMGQMMLASHASSRDDFGNSCHELDIMVECAQGLKGYYGSRLSGGGFGGCTVNLVAAGQAEAFARDLAGHYQKKTGIRPDMHLCKAVAGARGEPC